jgi:hypothetical protein
VRSCRTAKTKHYTTAIADLLFHDVLSLPRSPQAAPPGATRGGVDWPTSLRGAMSPAHAGPCRIACRYRRRKTENDATRKDGVVNIESEQVTA